MTELRIGGRTVDRQAMRVFATAYLTDGQGWGYPSYDGFDSAHARGPLTDADLLAPVLLSVGRTYSIKLYESLKRVVPELESSLERIPHSGRLVDADDGDVKLIGELFSVLDGGGVPGARGTVLAKVLHRKRPDFIPLYDRYIHAVYVGKDAPFPVARAQGHRTWREFMELLARAIRDDLRRESGFWREIVEVAPPSQPITDVRALDIVAWRAGQQMVQALPDDASHHDDDEANEL
jgi:hypothetical protein